MEKPSLSNNWFNFGRAMAVVGVVLAPVALTIPDPYGKVILALDVGLANAATFLGIQGAKVNGEKKA